MKTSHLKNLKKSLFFCVKLYRKLMKIRENIALYFIQLEPVFDFQIKKIE